MLCPRAMITPVNVQSGHDFIKQLAHYMKQIDFTSLSEGTDHSKASSYIPKELHTSPYVWLRVDRVKRSLESPYMGPFKVIKRAPKYFTIELSSGAEDTVSIDRLKPAVYETTTHMKPDVIGKDTRRSILKPPASTSVRRSPRNVHWERCDLIHYI